MLTIHKEKENPLFNRKEIQAEIESDTSPKKTDVLKLLCEKFSVSDGNIKIKGIHGKFGSKSFKITANIYVSKEDKEKTEHKTKKEIEAEKKELESKIAEKPAEETPKTEAEPEQPAEENKEEQNQENKQE